MKIEAHVFVRDFRLSDASGKITLMLMLFAFIFPLLPLLNNKALAPLSVLLALSLFIHPGVRESWRCLWWHPSLGAALCAAFFGWMALSTAWSHEPSTSLLTLGKLAGSMICWSLIGAGIGAIDREGARRVMVALVVGAGTCTGFLALEVLIDGTIGKTLFSISLDTATYGYFWYKPAISVLALAISPIAGFLWLHKQPVAAAIAVFSVVTVSIAMEARTAAFAPLIAAVCAVIVTKMPTRWIIVVLKIMLVILFFAAAALVILDVSGFVGRNIDPGSGSRSIMHRLLIWEYVFALIEQKPLQGWGLNASKWLGNKVFLSQANYGFIGEAIPSHPHNGFLQITLELGLVGTALILGAGLRGIGALRLDRLKKTSRFFWLSGTLTVVIMLSFSFSLWSSWWFQVSAFTTCLICMMFRLSIGSENNPDGTSVPRT